MIPERWQRDVLGSKLSNLKIGGPLDFFSRPRSIGELKEDLAMAREQGIPFRVIGAGSDIVFADAGMRGLVIQPALAGCREISPEEAREKGYGDIAPHQAAVRYLKDDRGRQGAFLALEGKVDVAGEPAYVELEAGVPWGQAVVWSLGKNCVGLHWYARIPCNVGGAVYNNIHGESHLFSEVIVGVNALTAAGDLKFYPVHDLEFGYDYSRFHHSGEIIVSAVLRLARVNEEAAHAAKAQYIEWTKVKNIKQPTAPNCGSTFQNLSPEEVPEGHGAVAAGYYVDTAGLLGEARGGVQVYPSHGNFIVNTGEGSCADFIALVRHVREAVNSTYGFWLKPEIECIAEDGSRVEW